MKWVYYITAADIEEPEHIELDYINLTTHDGHFGSNPVPINWGHPDPFIRGPVIATVKHGGQRNAIGAHSGGYCIYTALAVAAGALNPGYVICDRPPYYQHPTLIFFLRRQFQARSL